jgi:hypothetical protein
MNSIEVKRAGFHAFHEMLERRDLPPPQASKTSVQSPG